MKFFSADAVEVLDVEPRPGEAGRAVRQAVQSAARVLDAEPVPAVLLLVRPIGDALVGDLQSSLAVAPEGLSPG